MDMIKAIRTRRSVRTFDGTPLRAEDAQKIMDFAESVNNPYGIPITWKLLDAQKDSLNSPVISGTNTYIGGKMRREKYAEEAFGYTFEKVVLYAEALGVGTTWIAGTMNRQAFEQAMELSDGEVMPCVSPLGYTAKKMSLRETVMRKGIKADTREDFSTLFYADSLSTPLTSETAGKLQLPLEMVRLAPSAVNKQPWRVIVQDKKVHFYEKKSKGYTDENKWDVQKIDMGIALSHFELGAEDAGINFTFEIKDPNIPTPDDMMYIASYTLD